MSPPLCIFCDAELGLNTKPEHILQNALGGRKTTRLAICSDHNETFGQTIDEALAKQVAFYRNQLQMESGTGRPPPALGEVQAGSRIVRIASDGRPHLTEKPFEVTPLGDGHFEVRIMASSEEHVEKILPHIAAQMRVTEDHLRAQLASQEVSLISERAGQIHYHTPLGGDLENRAMAKACLVLWSTIVGTSEIKGVPYAAAREWIAAGARALCNIDSRALPFREELASRYGPFFNLIYVRSDGHGRVVAHFTLYNICGWRIVLAESCGIPNRKIALVSNPLDPGQWSDAIAEEYDLLPEWLESPAFHPSGPQAQLAAILLRSQQSGGEREIGRIVLEIFEKHGVGADDAIIDGDLFDRVVGEIAQRTAYQHLAIPFEEKITGAELMARVKRGKR